MLGKAEDDDDGSTLLSEEDREHLVAGHITLRSELNELEAVGVGEALGWLLRRRRAPLKLIDESFVRTLHHRMFGSVWKWAGTYRKSQTNLGVGPADIPIELRKLRDDASYWLQNGTYPDIELAVRFHHRLVVIHPFPNGNGRLSRLMADALLKARGGTRLGWGLSIEDPVELRRRYLSALRAADDGDCNSLIAFAEHP